ncbi:terminase large subunit [Paenibacillus sp. EKM102P]|uniref:terminase large subunit n=1 Tax=unclassified Paenibacillus TaxID=185978 RepID=UPI00142D65C8|nr:MULTISPECIES: terminase TerL endonuclease subunit [unclassified Paenibacillus]KAF6618271.1 terminase large subunit [Paenibacillus sp. EKM101P]KAF6624616.1 terminase large subunit [Paenibacillus sp. EKM102P]KAF6635605.1 terminase large subunit [Paenibacillus sp. EKM10P]KAF6648685.1 terminase large subunit [Paenibacillus sp. EKM11P]
MANPQIYPYNTVGETDRVTAYALEVVSGRIIAGQAQRQACERHLRDLDRQGTEDFPYVFDPDKAHEIIEFAESLTLAEGEEPLPLELWGFQDFMFGSWNGWVTLDGYRRFRTSYVQVARQNGKSLGNAVPALFYGNFDGYNYPQVYCTATKEAQARIVLKECIKFIDADPELGGSDYESGLFDVKDYKSTILCSLTKGEIRALGRDTKTIDGFRPYFASVDEYHLHKDNQMYKLLADGTKKLKQCLISVITTAGFNINGPCYELYKYCKLILSGAHADETQFVFICELDKDDDVWDEANWPKANPLWTPETLDSLRSEAIKAKVQQGEELRNFLTKSLNRWVQFSDTQYMNMEHWQACESDTTIEDMEGKECYLGLDLSSGGDLTSGSLEFPLDVDGQRKYYIHSHSWIPAARVHEHVQSDHAPYDMWIMEGLLTPTETMGGVKTDYKYILAYYRDLIKKHNFKLKGIAYDPHNADAFLSDLEEFGVDLVEIVQSAKSLNDATVDFRLEVEAGNVIYDRRNKLLTWSMANAKTTSNSFGEIKIDKDPNAKTKRIDPVDAVIDSHKLTLSLAVKPRKSVYEERGPRSL